MSNTQTLPGKSFVVGANSITYRQLEGATETTGTRIAQFQKIKHLLSDKPITRPAKKKVR
jgi:hypothetical protein